MSTKRFTVIWMWEDNGQIGAKHVKAKDINKAFDEVAKNPPESADSVTLLAAVPGWHQVAAPREATDLNVCPLTEYPGYEPKEVCNT